MNGSQRKPWARSLYEAFLTSSISCVLSQLVTGEMDKILCDSTEERLWKLCLVPLDFTRVPLPSDDFAWCPSMALNEAHEYGCSPSLRSPPSERFSQGMVWKMPSPLRFQPQAAGFHLKEALWDQLVTFLIEAGPRVLRVQARERLEKSPNALQKRIVP